MKSITLKITLTFLLGVSGLAYALPSGKSPPAPFIPADLHEVERKHRSGSTQAIVPDEVIVSIKPPPDNLGHANLGDEPLRKKKTKKPSHLERLRQLYLLPLLQPIVTGGR